MTRAAPEYWRQLESAAVAAVLAGAWSVAISLMLRSASFGWIAGTGIPPLAEPKTFWLLSAPLVAASGVAAGLLRRRRLEGRVGVALGVASAGVQLLGLAMLVDQASAQPFGVTVLPSPSWFGAVVAVGAVGGTAVGVTCTRPHTLGRGAFMAAIGTVWIALGSGYGQPLQWRCDDQGAAVMSREPQLALLTAGLGMFILGSVAAWRAATKPLRTAIRVLALVACLGAATFTVSIIKTPNEVVGYCEPQ